MMESPARYSSRPFPPYRYVPGRAPHPTRDPGGHSRHRTDDPPAAFSADAWWKCEAYLYGIDLFNHGFWWEAHEALEGCWVAAGRTSATGLFLQGLIQIAVACLKHLQGFHDVADRMAREGLQKFPRDRARYLGIELEELRGAVLSYLEGERSEPPLIRLVTGR